MISWDIQIEFFFVQTSYFILMPNPNREKFFSLHTKLHQDFSCCWLQLAFTLVLLHKVRPVVIRMVADFLDAF